MKTMIVFFFSVLASLNLAGQNKDEFLKAWESYKEQFSDTVIHEVTIGWGYYSRNDGDYSFAETTVPGNEIMYFYYTVYMNDFILEDQYEDVLEPFVDIISYEYKVKPPSMDEFMLYYELWIEGREDEYVHEKNRFSFYRFLFSNDYKEKEKIKKVDLD